MDNSLKLEYLCLRLDSMKLIDHSSLPLKPLTLSLLYRLKSDKDKFTSLDTIFSTLKDTRQVFTQDYHISQTEKGTYLRCTDSNKKRVLNELLYAIQAIDGPWFYYDSSKDMFLSHNSVALSRSDKILIRRILELGWVFRRIKRFLELKTNCSFVDQSFTESISEDIRNYYKFIAILESKINAKDNSFTLNNLYIWSLEPLRRLKWIAATIETPQKHNRLVHMSKLISHGNRLVSSHISSVLNSSTKPHIDFAIKWLFFGSLSDPFDEFFISSHEIPEELDMSNSEWAWSFKYTIKDENIPPLLKRDYVEAILNAGKAIYFLSDILLDKKWIHETTSNMGRSIDIQSIDKFDDLMPTVNAFIELLNQRIKDKLFNEYKLHFHLGKMQMYLFMESIDLIEIIIKSIDESFSQLKNPLFYKLDAILEESIKSSSSNSWPTFATDSCKIRILECDTSKSPWDLVEFSYTLPSPMYVIVNKEMESMQNQITKCLLMVKRISITSRNIWNDINRIQKVGVEERLLHHLRLKFYSFLQFISSIERYLSFTVIHSSGIIFMKELHNLNSLDDIITCYANYIARIRDGCCIPLVEKTLASHFQDVWIMIEQFDQTVKHLKINMLDAPVLIPKVWMEMKKMDEKLTHLYKAFLDYGQVHFN